MCHLNMHSLNIQYCGKVLRACEIKSCYMMVLLKCKNAMDSICLSSKLIYTHARCMVLYGIGQVSPK